MFLLEKRPVLPGDHERTHELRLERRVLHPRSGHASTGPDGVRREDHRPRDHQRGIYEVEVCVYFCCALRLVLVVPVFIFASHGV